MLNKNEVKNMYYDIEKGIPIPVKTIEHKKLGTKVPKGLCSALYKNMEIGDSIELPSMGALKTFLNLDGYGKNKKLVHRTLIKNKSYRIWRVK